MTQPQEKEWLPIEETFLIAYNDGDKKNIAEYRCQNAIQAGSKFVGTNNNTPESIIAIVKIS